MYKGIEWLKEAVLKLRSSGNPEINKTEKERELGRAQQWAWSNCIDRVYELINQLDEPEVLSQEWVDKHRKSYTMEDSVEISELQNLLVPKQELPVIPKYVAEWVTAMHNGGFDLYSALTRLENNALSWEDVLYWEDVYEWYRANTHKFVNAYLTGKYEVEEEQNYYVLDSDDIPLLERVGNQIQKTITKLSIHEQGRDNSRFKLTEQEIKDYDERYWSFAVKVEELE